MLTSTSYLIKLRNNLLVSPFVLEAEIESEDTICCRFGALDEEMRVGIDEDGMVWLQNIEAGSYLRLALGPSSDVRIVCRSLDYFLAGLEECEWHPQHA